MKHKLSQLTPPALAGVIRERSARAAIAEAQNCMYDGATMLDLHLSRLESTDTETLRGIMEACKLPVLALYYPGSTVPTEEERTAALLRAVEAGAAGIDIQGYTYHLPSKSGFCGEDIYPFTKGNPKEIVTDKAVIDKQCALIERVHSMGAEVLLSCHPNIPMRAEQVVELALFLEKRSPDIIKIVTRAENEEDLAESIRAMLLLKKQVKTPVTYHAGGKAGMASRILNPLLGGQIAFCVDRFHADSTMEQLDLRTARTIVDNMKKIL